MSCNCNLAYHFCPDYSWFCMSNPDEYLGFMISDVARLMRTDFDRRVRKLGLTRAQWMVLTRLHRHAGASQSELADMMEVEKPTAGRLIDRLEAKGWVERRVHKTDRRINRIYLTPEAERVHKRIWKIAKETVNDAMSDLSRAESVQLLELLGRMKSRLVDDSIGSPTSRVSTVRNQRPPARSTEILLDNSPILPSDEEVVRT